MFRHAEQKVRHHSRRNEDLFFYLELISAIVRRRDLTRVLPEIDVAWQGRLKGARVDARACCLVILASLPWSAFKVDPVRVDGRGDCIHGQPQSVSRPRAEPNGPQAFLMTAPKAMIGCNSLFMPASRMGSRPVR